MGLLYENFETLEDLFLHELEDIYDAENRLTKTLPQMAAVSNSPLLRQAFEEHAAETENHVKRLEQVFQILGKKPTRETCPAMKGLIAEGNAIASARGDDDVRDAGLIVAAQKVEHYEIATYGSLRSLARRLNHHDVAELLQQTLDEEGATDHRLTDIAESHVNASASL